VQKGIAPRAEVSILFSGPFQYDDGTRLALRTMVMLLQSRLNEAIREQLGGTYSITAQSEATKFPRPEYRVRIQWTCDPARVDSLVQRVFEEIAFVKATLLTPDRVARVRDALLKELEDDSQENGWVLNQLVRRYEDGEIDRVGRSPVEDIAALNGYAIQLAAQAYLDTQNYVKVTLLPETK
jgi:zinc protease